MSIQSGFIKTKKYRKNGTSTYKLQSEWTSSQTVELGNGSTLESPTFSQASSRANIASGEALQTIFGKLMKWYTDLKTVAFSGSYNDLSDKPTIPTNTDANVAQTNTTNSAAYRLLLSYNANNTTQTVGARKSAKFTANPSTGELTATSFVGKLQGTADSAIGTTYTTIATLNSMLQLDHAGWYSISAMDEGFVNDHLTYTDSPFTDYSVGDFKCLLMAADSFTDQGCRYGTLIVTSPRFNGEVWLGRIWEYNFYSWENINTPAIQTQLNSLSAKIDDILTKIEAINADLPIKITVSNKRMDISDSIRN